MIQPHSVFRERKKSDLIQVVIQSITLHLKLAVMAHLCLLTERTQRIQRTHFLAIQVC